MSLKTVIVCTAISFGSPILFGQEEKLRTKEVSPVIQNYLAKNYPNSSKIKYYIEKEDGEILIESQFTINDDKYSLAFKNDSLIEVEIVLPFEELPKKIQSSIIQQLDTLFQEYKIIECQEVDPNCHCLYEIFVLGKSEKSSGYFELFFDENGNLVRKVEVIIEPISSQN